MKPRFERGQMSISEFLGDPIATGNGEFYEAHIKSMKTYILKCPRSDVSNFLGLLR